MQIRLMEAAKMRKCVSYPTEQQSQAKNRQMQLKSKNALRVR